MVNNPDLKNTTEALQEENAHESDYKFIILTTKDCFEAATVYGIVQASTLASAAIVMEGVDHLLSFISYGVTPWWNFGCTYTLFRKFWQQLSMPIKESVLNFLKVRVF